jgi:peptidoglycan/xylan/chitin deacetylase (PgdA/CDA1 family)
MKKVQIGYGVDVDAVSGWIGSYGGEDSICDISRGLQAGEVNVHRLLKMFKKYNMTQTFYIPGHSLETFPKECVAIRDVSGAGIASR